MHLARSWEFTQKLEELGTKASFLPVTGYDQVIHVEV